MKAWYGQVPTEARWILGTALAGGALLVGTFLFQAASLLFESVQLSARHEPRIARMLGYQAAEQELLGAAREFSRAVEELAFPAADDANAAGARLQQTLRGFAEDAGLRVVGSQLAVIVPEGVGEDEQNEYEGLFEQLAVDLSVDGPPIALDAFLVAISEHTPALATASIDIQRKRRSRGEGNDTFEFLSVRLRVVALKAAE